MNRPRKGGTARLAVSALFLALVLGAGCTSGGSTGPSPTAASPSATQLPSSGPTLPEPSTTLQAVRSWVLHWARAFITLGQEVVAFRQAERSGDLARMARLAAPMEGAARQVSAGIGLAPDPPPSLASRIPSAQVMLTRVERAVRSVEASCQPVPGPHCRTAGQSLFDLTEPLLTAFAEIFRLGGFPIPTPS